MSGTAFTVLRVEPALGVTLPSTCLQKDVLACLEILRASCAVP